MADLIVTIGTDTNAALSGLRGLESETRRSSDMIGRMSMLPGSNAYASNMMIQAMGAPARAAREAQEAEAARARALLNSHANQMTGQARNSFNNIAYMVQDFSSVAMQGGANSIGRAFGSIGNNLQVVTSAMGPWAMGIGTAAAVLLPLAANLLTAETALDKFGKKLAETESLRGTLRGIADDNIRLQASLPDMSQKDIRSGIQSKTTDIEVLKSNLREEELLRNEAFRKIKEDGRTIMLDNLPLMARGFDDIQKNFRKVKIQAPEFMRDFRSDEALPADLVKRLEKIESTKLLIAQREKDIGALRGADDDRRVVAGPAKEVFGWFAKLSAEAKETDNLLKQQEKTMEKQQLTARQLADERKRDADAMKERLKTPEERFSAGLDRARNLLDRGDIKPETFERERKRLREEASRGILAENDKGQRADNAALSRGSSGQIEAALKAANRDRDTLQEQTNAKLDKIEQNGRDTLKELQRGRGTTKQLAVR